MARAGRKRKSGKRQPNGQLARSIASQRDDTMETVIEARMRQYGMTRAQARSQLAGYEVGRMALRGDLGQDCQPYLDAVYAYVMATADYMRIKCPQMPLPKAMDYLAGRGASLMPEPSLKTVDRIVKRYEDMAQKLRSANPAERIVFHEVAYHDRNHGDDGKRAIVNCAERLMSR